MQGHASASPLNAKKPTIGTIGMGANMVHCSFHINSQQNDVIINVIMSGEDIDAHILHSSHTK